MNADRSFEDRLAARLRSLGLSDVVSTLLEAGAPLAWVGAQLGYLAGPFFGLGAGRTTGFLELLESPQRMAGFIDSLHQEPPP
jgi:hypothetical protein